jgi:ubiquinone/menaquinone biosynthesis C-methylase UbiE
LTSNLKEADAEQLPFADGAFDLVYSWGVLHHSPNTHQAMKEVYRVLRPGGIARIMIYHTYSLTGYMLWVRYGLLAGQPFRSLRDIYFNYLESPGTKAYSVEEAQEMLSQFSSVATRIELNHGDLLEGTVGQRHGGFLLSVAKGMWPRALIKSIFKNHGLMLLIEARK